VPVLERRLKSEDSARAEEVPMRRTTWAVSSFALLTTLLFVANLASASASPPFTATPSYAPYGGLAFVGHSIGFSTGTGSNKVPVAPSFKVASGRDRQSQLSQSIGSGTHSVDVYSGLENLSFFCAARCANGTYRVTVDWNVSWYAHLNSSCPGVSSGAVVLAAINMSYIASVVDETNASIAGTGLVTLYSHSLSVAGKATGGKATTPYPLKFTASLTHGSSYTIVTYFEVLTWAEAAGGVTAVCSSTANARIGVVTATTLESIKIS
jgi:hypothetical protein